VAETVRASAAYPSRFTPPGGRFGVLYVALAPDTAAAELRRRAEQLGVPVAALAPRAMLTLAVRLRRVLDLTDPGVREAWGLTAEDLAGDAYARCQEAAVAARADGYEAIRYPSAAVVAPGVAPRRRGRAGRGRRGQLGRVRRRAAPRVGRARGAQRAPAARRRLNG
jgi:RES domain-containing protein